jgi:hypothetical protein
VKHTPSFLDKFLHFFRELFIYHHNSLEFRAKIYTLPIVANEHCGDCNCEIEILEEIVERIYPDSIHRQNTLLLTVKEYIYKVHSPNGLGIDELILDIEKSIKREARLAKKINIEDVKLLTKCTTDPDSKIYQKRIIEYLEKLKATYIKNI